uniref:Glutamate receptor n=1 Tax=Magallana gigas TaxID=29159 RepID=K1P1B8_MAGGI
MEISVGRGWVQIQATEKDRDEALFDTEEIFKLHQSVCAKIRQGAKALLFVGTSKSNVAMHSIADKLSIPVLMPLSTKYSQTHSEFTVSLQPSLIRPIIDVIQKNGWKQVFYLFDSDEGLLRLQSLFQELGERHLANDVIIRSRRITNISDSYELLRSVDRQELNCSNLEPCRCTRPIILDLSTIAAFNETRKQIIDVGMNREHYHYLLANLGADELDLSSFKYGGMNVTGFSIKDPPFEENFQQSDCYSYKGLCPVSHKSALVMDTLEFLSYAVNKTGTYNNPSMFTPNSNGCDVSEQHRNFGRKFLNAIKETKVQGSSNIGTGTLALDSYGNRKDYVLNVKFFTFNFSKLEKVGIWQETGLSIKLHYCKPSKEPVASHNRTWIITTIVVKLPKTTHLIRDEKHIVYLTCGSRIFPRSGKGKMLFAGKGWEWGRWSLGLFLVTMLYRVCECNVSLNGV